MAGGCACHDILATLPFVVLRDSILVETQSLR